MTNVCQFGRACENRLVALVVRIAGRDDPDEVPVPPDISERDELARFLNRQGPYAQLWIRLASGQYVRYEHVVAIRATEDS